jgi:hypothetical protein
MKSNHIEPGKKCSIQKKGLFQAQAHSVVISLRTPCLLGFCLAVVKQFYRFISGHIQSVKLLQNMVSNTAQLPHSPPTPRNTLAACAYTLTQVGGNWE